jgi:hypothetical protein
MRLVRVAAAALFNASALVVDRVLVGLVAKQHLAGDGRCVGRVLAIRRGPPGRMGSPILRTLEPQSVAAGAICPLIPRGRQEPRPPRPGAGSPSSQGAFLLEFA